MINPDLYIDWDKVKKQDDIDTIQKGVNNVFNVQLLYLKVGTILAKSFKDEKLAKASLYQGAITRFLLENIKADALNDDKILNSIVNVYYRILTNNSASITDCLFVESYTKPYSNEIKSYLENKYQESKNLLLGYADLFEVDFNEDTDLMLSQVMTKYEDRNNIARLYQRLIGRCKKFGDTLDRVVAVEIKKIKDAYETIVALRNNNVYRIKTDKELKAMHF